MSCVKSKGGDCVFVRTARSGKAEHRKAMIASISVGQSHRASDGQQGPVIKPTLSQPIAKWGLHIISHFAACYTILNIQGDLWER
jgi:hypothetical protein